MCILDSLPLLPLFVLIQHMHMIASVDLKGSLISAPQGEVCFIGLLREEKMLHSFIFVVTSHEELGKRDVNSDPCLFIGS